MVFQTGQNILIVSQSKSENAINLLRNEVGESGKISVEVADFFNDREKFLYPDSNFDGVFITLLSSPIKQKNEFFSEILRLLKPGSRIVIQELASKVASTSHEQLESFLKLAGFVNVVSTQQNGEQNSSTVELNDLNDENLNENVSIRQICGSKPTWEIGTSAKISLKKKEPKSTQLTTWSLSAEVDDQELEDEDKLLEPSDLLLAKTKPQDDCEPVGGSKKACKNCVCGRAEQEATISTVKIDLSSGELPKSSCGSCYLGDAFRCAGCPMKGLPPFKPGEKVTISLDDDDF